MVGLTWLVGLAASIFADQQQVTTMPKVVAGEIDLRGKKVLVTGAVFDSNGRVLTREELREIVEGRGGVWELLDSEADIVILGDRPLPPRYDDAQRRGIPIVTSDQARIP